MRFPKPLVYVGFILIAAAFVGIIYEAFFKSEPEMTVEERVARKRGASMVIDKVFEEVKEALVSEKIEVKEKDFEDFKKIHHSSYVSKYLHIAQELDRGRHTTEESQKKNEDFHSLALETLKTLYLRKYGPKNPPVKKAVK